MPVSAVRILRVVADAEQTDAELLGRFVESRDEAAFALLVRRHGAMVYGVCRRILPTEQDAEDAFQATFLVLAEKARTVAPREAVGGWLHGVARRAALLSRRSIARRRERMGEVPERPANRTVELRAMLDEELARLPNMYRTVLVLCDLEGRTRREAAAVLGWPEGTVAGRLVRARELLAKRLAPSVSIAALLAGTASARVPEVLPPAAAIPSGVAALTHEVLGAVVRGKLMKAATAVLLLACAGFGVVLHAGQKPGSAPPVAAATGGGGKPVNPPKADDVVWGEEVGGLQAGLSAGARTYRHGETAKLTVKLRNVGKADVKLTHGLLREYPPEVTDKDGVEVSVSMPPMLGIKVRLEERVIKPGETITLYHPEVAVAERLIGQIGPEPLVSTPTLRVAPGKYRIAYGRMIQSHPTLATGAVEIEVKDAEPDAFTAWGKEAGGLQAGLEIKEKRAYRLGETVTIAVRVRNVGKAAVTFAYIPQYLDENPPAVTGADGTPIRQGKTSVTGLIHLPVDVTLEPGKEVVLETRIHGAAGQPYELRPADGGGKAATRSHPLHVGTGKITLQYDRVFGDTSIGRLKVDPALAELATGKLELEVTDAPPDAAGHRFTVVVDKAEPVFRAPRCAFLDNRL